MKKIFLILVLIFLIGLSFAQEKHLSNDVVSAIKCILDSKEKIEVLTNFIETLFVPETQNQWIEPLIKLMPILKECLNFDFFDFLPS